MKLVGFTISVKRVKTLESAWNRSSGQSRNVEFASSRFSESRKIPGRKTFPICRRDRAVGLPGACRLSAKHGQTQDFLQRPMHGCDGDSMYRIRTGEVRPRPP